MKIHLQEVSDNERCLFGCIRIKQNRLTKGILKKCVKHLSLKSTKGMHDATKKNYFLVLHLIMYKEVQLNLS